MMRVRRPGIWVWWLLIAMAGAASAQAEDPTSQSPVRATTVAVRTGNHSGFGRVVFDVANGTDYRLSRDGDRVQLNFSRNPFIGTPAALARNILSISGGEGEAVLVVAAGARVRPSRIGQRVVVDVFDPSSASPPRPSSAPALTLPLLPVPPIPPDAPTALAAADAPLPAAAPVGAVPSEAVPENSLPAEPPAAQPVRRAQNPEADRKIEPSPPAAAIPEASGPVALVAARTGPAALGPGAAFSVPFGAEVGAAALRRGSLALIVFDQRRPVDMAALREDPLLANASVQLLPAATLIRIRLPAGLEVALSRPSTNAWTVALIPGPVPIHPIRPVLAQDETAISGRARVLLPGDAPGQAISLADPDTGATLLLGTQRKPGQGLAVARHTPRYVLLPTWQGVAVLPLADSLSLRAAKDGFVLTGADLPSAQAAATDAEREADAAGLTRRFDFPALPASGLQRRIQSQVAAAAAAPARARGKKRLAAAQTMIALGLGVEAQAMLQVATEEDPALAETADAAGLAAIAAMLADRMEEARAIDDPRLTGTDEIALWRAVRAARQQKGSPQAAAAFAATLPLVLAYPPGLRDRLLPMVIETMIVGGEAAAATPALVQHKDNPGLALARAMKLQADGNVDGALAAYDAVVNGPDRRQRALAASNAVELSLAEHRIDAAAAADALDRRLYSWRGGRHELELRVRVATLRAQAGGWRPALALLRETLGVFPDQKAEITAAMQNIFTSLLRDKAADIIAPLDLIALLDENADLLADAQNAETQNLGTQNGTTQEAGGQGSRLQAQLADKLLALDLPRRAGPQLERLMQAVPPGAGRAGFGASLAALRLREGDPKGALTALAASAQADLPANLADQRALLSATASARSGDQAKALATLAPLTGAAAGELRVTILEQAGDWPAAATALADQAATMLPPEGSLNDTQRRWLLRLASAASQSGDEALLERLRTQEGPRMASGPLSDMFKLLTAGKVQSAADLKRAGQEMALARALPAGLKALQEPAAMPGQIARTAPTPLAAR